MTLNGRHGTWHVFLKRRSPRSVTLERLTTAPHKAVPKKCHEHARRVRYKTLPECHTRTSYYKNVSCLFVCLFVCLLISSQQHARFCFIKGSLVSKFPSHGRMVTVSLPTIMSTRSTTSSGSGEVKQPVT